MIDFRPVLQIVGRLLIVLAVAMQVPAVADLVAGDPEWKVFAIAAGLTAFVGLALELGMRSSWRTLSLRQAFLATALSWAAACAFASLPFAFGKPNLSAPDALFEATCGLTATNATVLAALERLPSGILLWRGLLQWVGGMAALVMAVAVLPALKIGGQQLFRIDIPAADEKASPRTANIATTLTGLYVGFTVVLTLALWAAGMTGFEAMLHAMATISTGGFSTWDASIGHYNRVAIDIIVMIGMLVGGMPFPLLVQVVRGNRWVLARSAQLRFYLAIIGSAGLVMALWLALRQGFAPFEAILHGLFTVISVTTGTGFSTVDYSGWTGMPAAAILFLALLGGCSGSTTGGIKIFRLQLMWAEAVAQMRQLRRPHAVLIARFNGRPIPAEILESVMGFLFVYALSFAALAVSLGLFGLDFVSAISAAAAAVTNLGTGLGPVVGPAGNFSVLADGAKGLLCVGMLLGRLEVFPFLVLFLPAFWRQ